MSSLRDIMDVDVEPLESQAYRRAKEAAQQQASLPSIDQPSATPSPPLDDKDKGKAPIKRRRSNRVSKPSSNPSTPGPNIIRRRSSAAAREAMDFNSGYQAGLGVGGSNQASMSGSPQQSSRGSEQPMPEVPVKYTPVTGRISRAKKGVPVHTCDICRPVKTFTRAEHLRRHQLSHQKPAYPCTFQDCERAFHRPDLLARHLHRHETQGEKAYRSGGSRSRRASSSASDSRTPPLKVETPSQGTTAGTNQISPAESLTPRTSANPESSMTAFSASFQDVTFAPSTGNSHKRSASDAQLAGAGPYSPSPSSGTTARPMSNFDQITSSPFQSNNETNLTSGENNFSRTAQQGYNGMFSFEGSSSSYPGFNSPHVLPLLRIPEETYTPGASHTQDNSPWCSSASDSTYSTQSEGSRNGRHWTMRGRSHSVNTTADWSATVGGPQWSPHSMSTTPQDLRGSPFDPLMEQFETPYSSPRMTPPTSSRQLLDVPNSFGGYYMESVGTPALSTYSKPMAQIFSASPTRISDAGLASIDRRKDLVESQSLGSLGTIAISSPASYQTQLAQLEPYISSYWQSFDVLFPIIHRGTFDPTEDSLLSSAMAAMGTQYHDSPEARQKGIELNDYCRKSIGLCLNWNLHTMQAIFLTEVFTRFRGRKTNVQISRHFEDLCTKLLNNSSRDQTPFSTHSSNVASTDGLLDPFNTHQTSQNLQQSSLQSEWTQWADTETRQRLLAACFAFDVQRSMYHEQKQSDVHLEETNSMLCLPCPENIWNAPTATEWQSSQSADYAVQPLSLIEQDLSSQYVLTCSTPFLQFLHICSLATRLPSRDDPTYPNDFLPNSMGSTILSLRTLFPTSPLAHAYLALYHTPLHDLLAIAGDTWVFGKKITPPSAFHSAQSRLKIWASSLAAAAATQHACHVISTVLQPEPPEVACVSDYWGLYTAALICWAFGHRYQSSSINPAGSLSRSNSSSAAGNLAMEIDSPLSPTADEAKLKALRYVNNMLELGTEDLLTSKASMRGETVGVIDAVKAKLELDGVGSKCMMIVDATLVLTRIKEGGRGKWF